MSIAIGVVLIVVGLAFLLFAVHRIRDPRDEEKWRPRVRPGRTQKQGWFSSRQQSIVNELVAGGVGIALGAAVLIFG